ncbi:prolyl oligopeptidase family serine peptidase [Paraferrimonas sp. SM1919]|uniref:S9 family peptidase n=1 Tax=Paraferrimonas sp. SM1919 TaxID=2662263 RepID=UPI0013D056B9|nr:prolyl oligopeptidase family serine peptidase [Paraferrimonas sp. SM1919]
MQTYKKISLSITAAALLSACQGTSYPVANIAAPSVKPATLKAAPVAPIADQTLTMKQIMANPDWMGLSAYNWQWQSDSKGIVYQTKGLLDANPKYFSQAITSDRAQEISFAQQHTLLKRAATNNPANTQQAYLYKGNVFVKDLTTGNIEQVTQDAQSYRYLFWGKNNTLSFATSTAIFSADLTTNKITQIAEFKFAAKPKSNKHQDSYLAKQQRRLINFVALSQDNKQAQEQYNQDLAKANSSITADPIYLGKDQRVVDMALAPSGRYVFMALADTSSPSRSKHDVMPDYIGNDGYVDVENVRRRVAEDEPKSQRFVLVDLYKQTTKDIALDGLQGFDEDVLASVRAENAKTKGDSYTEVAQDRQITLMLDWGWRQSAINWHPTQDKLLVMLEALDNKDRWIAKVDLEQASFSTEHRLHDEAWINYTHNEFNWINGTDNYYYLSEQDGYSHIYLKTDAGHQQLTDGDYVVSNVQQSNDGKSLYYRANKQHPGIYNVYKVDIATASSQPLTNIQGQVDYKLSPDNQKLLLEVSKRTQMPELYVQQLASNKLTKLTNTSSERFKAYPWQQGEVVAIPSSHQDKPVYARIYKPANFDATKQYPAVIFTHGAGYLQNAHFGWSGYFREFMFHNLLTQKGYVVMDIDYRGSKGYGRDWRTAQYRQMGTPEVQDMADGVKYMADNYSVDSSRVGTYGGSYGGFLTFMSLFTQPDLFQAGAALRPVTDWAHYNAPYTSNILNRPDVDPIAYERSSPIEMAEGLNKPLLIMTGVLDDNVFFQDSVRLVQRLIELEKDNFETAIYPVEPHGFVQPSSWRDEYSRILKLFEQNLKKD